jgi:hypothetical protein
MEKKPGVPEFRKPLTAAYLQLDWLCGSKSSLHFIISKDVLEQQRLAKSFVKDTRKA